MVSTTSNLIIIPTYNEVKNIAPLLKSIWDHVPDIHVLVVDDNSSDGTAKVVKDIQKTAQSQLFIIEREGKLGLGTAYLAGFKWALDRKYEKVIEMDADFSHPAAILPQMIDELGKHNVVIGSRYVEGGGTVNWSFIRKLISKGGSLYARTILGIPIRDLTGGFNGWHREVLKSIDLGSIVSEGYAFQIELKHRAYRIGYSLKEIPIIFSERRAGQSKMSGKIIIEAMYRVWGMAIRVDRMINNGILKSQ